jgi:nitronate monooxygenase
MGIRYPIVQAGMSGFTTPDLVAEVSNAGGLGILGASRMTSSQLQEAIDSIKEKTDQPFGVNLLLAPPEQQGNKDVATTQNFLNHFRQNLQIPMSSLPTSLPPSLPPSPATNTSYTRLPPSYLQEQLQIVFDEHVPLLSLGMGDSGKIAGQAHKAGAKVMSMVTTTEEAIRVAEAGADIIVAQGSEAGGHRSTFGVDPNNEPPLIGTMALVPQVIDALSSSSSGFSSSDLPVIASGGIVDGRGLVASLSLGASGVMLGTRFLLAKENNVFQSYQDRILSAKATDTLVTNIFTGRYARCIRNKFVIEYLRSGPKPLAWPFQALCADDIYKAAQSNDQSDYFPLLAGQGLGLLKQKGQSASEMVEEIALEAKNILGRLNGITE